MMTKQLAYIIQFYMADTKSWQPSFMNYAAGRNTYGFPTYLSAEITLKKWFSSQKTYRVLYRPAYDTQRKVTIGI